MTVSAAIELQRAPLSTGMVLAAGGSRRLGRPKQLLPVWGRPLLEVVLARVCASQLDDVVVVLGESADEISRTVDIGRARITVNTEYATGMSSSLRAGVKAVDVDMCRLVVILGDQPNISATLIDDLLALHCESGLPAAALSLGGLLHPPVVLDRSLWGELLALSGDVGCRALIRSRPELVAVLPVAQSSGQPVDIDTEADYQELISAGD